jgi:N6-L-threonylcarbamoyladenine synthase
LYFLRDELKKDETFIQRELPHVCASYQHAIVSYLLKKVKMAIAKTAVTDVTLSGGVSANSELRKQFLAWGESQGIHVFIPPMALCTDNAAMIGLAAYYKYVAGDFASLEIIPLGRMPLN